MQLRDYQQAAISSLFSWWTAGRQGEDPLIHLPTASGKTIIFAHLIKRLMSEYRGVSVLILAHRKELVSQAEEKLLKVWPGAPVGVYAASLSRREVAQITIASRDTIAPVIDDIGQFTFVIVDECHRMSVKDEGRYKKIISKMREKYSDLVVIGFTATPFRLGQGRIYGMGKPFADIAYKKPMLEMIKEGWLAPLTSLAPVAGEIDTTGIRTRGGDFDEHELSERATADELVQAALDEWMETAYKADRKHSVFFCVSVLHAGMVSEKLARMGVDAPVVTGGTPDTERDEILRDFNQGKFAAIVNIGVLTEGWDSPLVDCIVLMRPTQSAALYVQMIGRGLRTSPETGKENCFVLDFGGNIERLGPVDKADEVEPKKQKRKPREEAPYKRCGEWSVDGSTWKNGCGEKNATAAVECCSCGRPFISHEIRATRGGVTSVEEVIEWFNVESISCRVAISQNTGNPYLRVSYHCGLFETFYNNLMLGYPGGAGIRATRQWELMTGERCSNPYDAEESITSGQSCFRKVDRIAVNVADRWKNIVQIEYKPLDIPSWLQAQQL